MLASGTMDSRSTSFSYGFQAPSWRSPGLPIGCGSAGTRSPRKRSGVAIAPGLANFFQHYQAVTTTWSSYDNTDKRGVRLIASGKSDRETTVKDPGLWATIKGGIHP